VYKEGTRGRKERSADGDSGKHAKERGAIEKVAAVELEMLVAESIQAVERRAVRVDHHPVARREARHDLEIKKTSIKDELSVQILVAEFDPHKAVTLL